MGAPKLLIFGPIDVGWRCLGFGTLGRHVCPSRAIHGVRGATIDETLLFCLVGFLRMVELKAVRFGKGKDLT